MNKKQNAIIIITTVIVSVLGLSITVYAQTSSNATISQSQDSMFSNSQVYDKSNTYRDPVNHFSITPPKNWKDISQPTSMFGTLIFSSNDPNPDLGLLLGMMHFSEGSSSTMDFSSLTDDQILNKFIIHEVAPDTNSSILESNLTHYVDGVKIKLVYQENYLENATKKEDILFHFNNGEEYRVYYVGTNITIFDKYSNEAEKSINTLYVSDSINSTSVPEFPISMIILLIAISTAVLFYRIKLKI